VSTTIDRLVVPLDGSDTTLVAFRVAEVLARRSSGRSAPTSSTCR
jgi:hypothetical protein